MEPLRNSRIGDIQRVVFYLGVLTFGALIFCTFLSSEEWNDFILDRRGLAALINLSTVLLFAGFTPAKHLFRKWFSFPWTTLWFWLYVLAFVFVLGLSGAVSIAFFGMRMTLGNFFFHILFIAIISFYTVVSPDPFTRAVPPRGLLIFFGSILVSAFLIASGTHTPIVTKFCAILLASSFSSIYLIFGLCRIDGAELKDSSAVFDVLGWGLPALVEAMFDIF